MDQATQRRRKRLEIPHFGLHVFQLGLGFSLHITAPGLRADLKIKQFLDLMEREAQGLGILDEPEPPFLVFAIDPVSRRSARRRTEQPAPFVVPHGLDIDPDRFRELPDGAPNCHLLTSDETLHPVPWY
jgi:hypothetical protein